MKKISIILLTIALLGFVSSSWGKVVNLHAEPKDGAPTVGQIDLAKGMIPIFSPQGSDWTKLADPHNGNVGWVKTAEINEAIRTSGGVTFTQKIIQGGTTQPGYQMIKIGQPTQINNGEIDNSMKKMREQQLRMQHAIDNVINQMNKFYREEWEIMKENGWNMPAIPAMFAPDQEIKQNQSPSIKPNSASSHSPANTTTPRPQNNGSNASAPSALTPHQR